MSLSSSSSSLRRVAALALVPLVGGAALVTAAPAQAVDVTSPVVISEVYGGGGNTGAVYTNDFIELYNNGETAVELSTWSVQYASTTGSSWQRTNLTGVHTGQVLLPHPGGGRNRWNDAAAVAGCDGCDPDGWRGGEGGAREQPDDARLRRGL